MKTKKGVMGVVIGFAIALTFGGAAPAKACCDCFYIGGVESGEFCGCGINTGFNGCKIKTYVYTTVCIQTGGACGAV